MLRHLMALAILTLGLCAVPPAAATGHCPEGTLEVPVDGRCAYIIGYPCENDEGEPGHQMLGGRCSSDPPSGGGGGDPQDELLYIVCVLVVRRLDPDHYCARP